MEMKYFFHLIQFIVCYSLEMKAPGVIGNPLPYFY